MNRLVLPVAAGLVWLALYFLISIDPAAAQSRRIVDSAGRTVDVPGRINRVLAAGPPASVLVYALAPEKMAGWVREPSAADKEFIAEAYRNLPVHGRLTGKGSTASIETVLSMKPDVIIDVGSVDATYASLADRVQEQTGVAYVLLDGSFGNTARTLRTAADILGVGARGDELAGYAEAALDRLRTELAGVPDDERPRVYYGRGPDGLETGLAGSINTEVLDAAGAKNVAAAAGRGGLANVSIEQVLSWNPDVVLTLDQTFQRAVAMDPLWANVNAVKAGRVYRAPTAPFGWFDAPPGINRIVGVAWLTAVLYPGRGDVDLEAETRAFYRLFYHVDLTDAQIDRLLAGAR